jgi:hypothetical protein
MHLSQETAARQFGQVAPDRFARNIKAFREFIHAHAAPRANEIHNSLSSVLRPH